MPEMQGCTLVVLWHSVDEILPLRRIRWHLVAEGAVLQPLDSCTGGRHVSAKERIRGCKGYIKHLLRLFGWPGKRTGVWTRLTVFAIKSKAPTVKVFWGKERTLLGKTEALCIPPNRHSVGVLVCVWMIRNLVAAHLPSSLSELRTVRICLCFAGLRNCAWASSSIMGVHSRLLYTTGYYIEERTNHVDIMSAMYSPYDQKKNVVQQIHHRLPPSHPCCRTNTP